jgi:glycosyltransferase involved in cell wall biosynthesis
MVELSIVIPCYNEAGNLPALIQKCSQLLTANPTVEIVLVDNGSSDNSAAVMADLIAKQPTGNLRSHTVVVNQGYGYGILQGLDNARGEILCWTHADLQTDIFDCIKAYNLWLLEKDNTTVIKGKREGRKFFDVLFTSGMQAYVLFKLGTNVNDINGQPKLFSKVFYDQIKEKAPHDFSLDLYLLIQARKNGKIIDFPVFFSKRTAGEAKGGSGNLSLKLKLVKRTLGYINTFSKNN